VGMRAASPGSAGDVSHYPMMKRPSGERDNGHFEDTQVVPDGPALHKRSPMYMHPKATSSAGDARGYFRA
jgi:hypothetical protein